MTTTMSKTEALQELVDEAERRLESTEEQMFGLAVELQRTLNRAVDTLKSGLRVNPLGELQSSAREFDRLCAVHAATADELVRLHHYLKAHQS